ncbi:MAG TPA: NAD-dependent epimerase/dehydratase family protein [Micromonosporaceae bacterium]
MRVLIFGATGMVGQGVLRECLLDERVTEVLTIGRRPTGQAHPKLREVVTADLTGVGEPLSQFHACFFCLGVSSVGMGEAQYRRITYDLTLAVARPLAEANHEMTFVYVSGAGTDTTGRMMWARVKGETEDALLALPFHGYAMRPAFIQPMHGVRSRTFWYRAIYLATSPLSPLMLRVAPRSATTTQRLGRAMIQLALAGSPKRILDSADINALATASIH